MAEEADLTDTPRANPSQVRLLALLGILGPAVYVVAVAVGGWLWSGYSQYGETISTLTSRGAPNQELLVPLFGAYNICVVGLAFGLHRGITPRRYGALGPFFLAAAGADGLVLFVFPQESWGAPQFTPTGTGHVVIAGFGALFFLLAMVLLWRRLREDTRWAGFDRFTIAMLAAGVVLGAFAASSVTTPYAGLAERLSIGTFLLWTEVLALGLYRWSLASSEPTDHRISGRRATPGL